MSGQEKTEQPTGKKLGEARDKGQVVKSQDLNAALVLCGIALLMNMYGPYFFSYLLRVGHESFSHEMRLALVFTPTTFLHLLNFLFFHVMMILLPFLLTAMAVGVAANVAQVKWLFSLQVLKPSFSKLNILSGFKRLFFSQKSAVELLKGLAKMSVVGVSCFCIIHARFDHLTATSQMGFTQAWLFIFDTVKQMLFTLAMIMLAIGAADWFYQRHSFMKQMKMTKQEVKDEMKNTDGNPQIKSRIRSAGRRMLEKRMLKAVENADVLVTNPTHFAVAIQYDPDVAPAPRVIAKGSDLLAFQLREMAKTHKVPIIENKPLARSLFAQVEVDHMIPPELFIAVAEVLAYVFKRNKGRRRRSLRSVTGGSI